MEEEGHRAAARKKPKEQQQMQSSSPVHDTMPSTSHQPKKKTYIMTSAEEKQLEDINMKIKLAKDIVDACEVEKHLKGLRFPVNEDGKRFSGYVGSQYEGMFFDPDIQKIATKKRTLQMMLEESKNMYFYSKLREFVYNLYVNERRLPTKSCLLLELHNTQMGKTNILSQVLNKGGFIWTPLPNLNKCILVEKPGLVAARFKYLRQMFKYRSKNRPIVYLEEGNYVTAHVAYELQPNNVFIMAASKNGVIDIDFRTHTDEKQNDYLEKFVEKIAHLLPNQCVLVLNERPHHVRKTVPTEFSSRKDMMEWLQDCKIPFEETMHSSELFALVQRSKMNFPTVKFRLEGVAKKFEAEVVYRPYLMLLNFFQYVDLVSNRGTKRHKHTLLNLKNDNTDWNSIENALIDRERKIFEEDMKMEVIIDKLMTMASDGKVSPDDVKQLPDSKYECAGARMPDTVIL